MAESTDGNHKRAYCLVIVTRENNTENPGTDNPGGNTPGTDNPGSNNPGTDDPGTEDPDIDNPSDSGEDTMKLNRDGYKEVFNDEFNGNQLDRSNWNVELHEKGWVNSEWQEYVDSEENISVSDGKLYLKPVKKVAEDGTATYTSGRINTQNKQDFKYGLFEVKAKVPAGMGYLPAFWLMPTDENVYGQWPKCGEIDAMEVMGQETNKLYGTIHYGEPHNQGQGTYTLKDGNFADEFHTFAVEWELGSIKWYVDDVLYHEEHDWFSATEGKGTISYPAPFDQKFYMILNLAVGGSWVGYPDDTTTFDDQAFVIDHVRAYQKDSYDENVSKPEKEPVVLRDPDATGNYINNGDFSVAEQLDEDDSQKNKNWQFKLAQSSEAEAVIENNSMLIKTANPGSVDYSVQLVQAELPLQKYASYNVSFDAKASENRTMRVDVKAPDRSYKAYMDTFVPELTTEMQTYETTFKMTDADDANGRLEFNMGAGSSADIMITNVRVEKIADPLPEDYEKENEKTVLNNGNYVYNGEFQEGDKKLGFWNISDPALVNVTSLEDGRRLAVTGNGAQVTLSQNGLALAANGEYSLRFDAQADVPQNLRVSVAGNTFEAALTPDRENYSYVFTTGDTVDNRDISFIFDGSSMAYLDNVFVTENKKIKNGSFNAGLTGYVSYVSDDAKGFFGVDNLSEGNNNALQATIENTADADWKVQMKQENVGLEKGKCYRLTFKARASINRELRVVMQGPESRGWSVYSGDNIVELTNEYQTFVKEFKMTEESDPQAFLSICYGTINGEHITQKHTIDVDDIELTEIDESELPQKPEVPAGENMLVNPSFTSVDGKAEGWTQAVQGDAAGTIVFDNGKAIADIQNAGTEEWHAQLINDSNMTLEKGKTYTFTMKASATAGRIVKIALMGNGYNWVGGSDIFVTEDGEQEYSFTFTVDKETDTTVDLYISLGRMGGDETPASVITLSELSLVQVGTDL